MSKEIYISSTPHETRLAIVEKDELSEIYYERENEYTLAGSIYNGKVTRVLPGMQSAFVDVGLERDAFLYITDFLEEQGESADFEGGEPRRSSGGGDRGREQGREPQRDNQRDQQREPVEAARQPEPVAAEGYEAEPGQERGDSGDETAGEGSRTWRGRRGRRRGRGGEGRGPGQATESPVGSGDQSTAPEVEAFEAEPVLHLEASAAPEETVSTRESSSRDDRGRGERGRETGSREGRPREERGRDRDRGGRDRGADRGGAGRFGDRNRRPETAEAAGPELSGGAEPLILPGESLSKYRKGEDGRAADSSASLGSKAQANLVAVRPSTEFSFTAAGWDGGAVLPGETLSRRRGTAGESGGERSSERPSERAGGEETERAGGGQGESGRDRRRERDRQRGRGGRPEAQAQTTAQAEQLEAVEETPTSFRSGAVMRETLDPSEAVQPGVSSQHEPETSDFAMGGGEIGASDDVPSFEPEAFEAQQQVEAVLADDVEYVAETDYAPATNDGPATEVLEAVQSMYAGLEGAIEPAGTQVGEEFHEETTEYEPGEDASASYRVDPAGPSEFRQTGLVGDDFIAAEERTDAERAQVDEAFGHEFTAVQATGEMLSELPEETVVENAEANPSNPVEHETAVQSVHLDEAEGTPVPSAQTVGTGNNGSPQMFAPGDGELEEELLDEDDTELLDVAASYGDDTEEETFEAGAEIGSLARDRALEQLTRTETTLIEEDEDEDEDEDDFDIDEEEMEEDELDGSEEIAGSDISEMEEDEEAEGEEATFDEEEGDKPAAAAMGEFPEFTEEPGQRDGRRERNDNRSGGNREARRGEGRDRGGRGGRGGRDSRGMANSRSNGRPQGRHSVQNTDLPAISDLLKPGQEVLVQIAKEPIAKKGARITSHIALPGRFLVFMPTVNHVGVSRKIESDGERRRLKEVLLSEKGEAGGGFIVRTAAMGASEDELRSDLRFLLNLWADIKQRSEASKSPALIYHDLNLVERILRDQVTDNFSAIWVDTEDAYERVLRFLQRFQPALMRRVKLYTKDTPLFEQFGISEEINKALRSKVWLKSGGSIVINQTEALVAIDINTGKFVGKTARLEDTIVKTNLDAIPEIVRQIRLRDLGGIIVIDFIDMDDRKNRQKVLLALEEELKNDRAPSKVLQFNDFGLVAITRKRVKQSLERTLSTTCGICAGTGMVKSPITVCNEIYIELRKMHKQLDKGDVMLRVNPEVVKQLKSGNGKWLQEMEEISGKTILVKSDPSLHPEQFDIH